jgi:ABC-type spermidine/putrescine transport system permease subunit II
VDQAFRVIERQDMQQKRDPRRWRLFLGYTIGLFAVVFALFVWGSNMGERTYGIGLGVWVISMMAGLALAIAIVRRNRAFAFGLTGGALTALLVPFIIVFIIAGLCVLSTNPTFFPAPPPTAPPA